jgi:3-hydroxyacyl-CoA dehydrogenase
VRALDTPNFIANRIGMFSMLAVMHHTRRLGLGFDEVDALTGPKIGRATSATYRTLDVVGLDTAGHVIRTMRDSLPDDPWHAYFEVPAWLADLIQRGALGQKSKAGIYRKEGQQIQVLDVSTQDYRASSARIAEEVERVLKVENPAERLATLRASAHPQAQFLWAIYRDLFHYCAVQLRHVADNARDVDLAMRWGYGWRQGPFETWQAAGWPDIARAIAADIRNGKAMSNAPLPSWVGDLAAIHTSEGSWSARRGRYVGRSVLPVYQRQLFPERVLGDGGVTYERSGETLLENDGVRLWRLREVDARIGIVSFKSKMHAIGEEVLDGLMAAVAFAGQELDGVVLWHEAPFAVGADLKQISKACAAGRFDALEAFLEKFQRASQTLKYAQVPTVAAVQGLALGGGCEFVMHAAKRVLAL